MSSVENTIELWNVHFDSDQFSYTLLSKAKALQSIRTFAEFQISDSQPNKDEIIDNIAMNVENQVDTKNSDAVLMVLIGDARVHLKRITLDHQNPVNQVLLQAYSQVDESTKIKISELFTTPLSF